MKILVFDGDGVGLDFALRCTWAGHQVKMWLYPNKHPNVGKGLVDRIPDWRRWMGWADLIYMTDNSKYYRDLKPYFDQGYPIWGTNSQAAALETDRKFGMDMMQMVGIDIPEYHTFSKYEEAEAFVQKNPGRWACKPFNDADKSKAYLCKNSADMCYMFRKWAKEGKPKCDFLLQEFIAGTEFAVGGWFNWQTGWLGGVWEENFEHKKLMNDDKGPNTGEMGTAMKYVEDSQLAHEMLEPLTSVLAALKFTGSCDVNVIIDKTGKAWPLEFTVRAGWPASYLQYSLNKGDPAKWMADALNGVDSLKVKSDVAIGVVIALPDFPYSSFEAKRTEGIPIYGIDEHNIEHVHLGTVQKGTAPHMVDGKVKEQECFVSAGNYVLIPVGLGSTVEKARDRAYKLIDDIEIPNDPIYRTDIGKRIEKQLPELHKHGYATEWEYK